MYTCEIDLTEFERCVALTKSELEEGLHHAVRHSAEEAVRLRPAGQIAEADEQRLTRTVRAAQGRTLAEIGQLA